MVQFESNETVKTVNVATLQDTLFERNETFEVSLQVQNEYKQLGIDNDPETSTLRVTIIDDDGMSVCYMLLYVYWYIPTLELNINFLEQLYSVFENESVLRVQLECSQPPYRKIPVTLKLNPINVTSKAV